MGVVRVTAMAPGSVEYLLHGCDSRPAEEATQDLDSPAAEPGEQPAAGPRAASAAGSDRAGAAGYLQAGVHAGEPDGVWLGRGMEGLGLSMRAGQTADPGDVRALFGQLRYPTREVPKSTEKNPIYLGSKPRKFRTAAQLVEDALKKEPVNPVPGERVQEIEQTVKQQTRRPTAYYDVTFSPVKSVSIMYAALLAGGDIEGADAIRDAHNEAIRIAIASVEDDLAYVRTGRHEGRGPSGRTVGRWERATGLMVAVYAHHTNRDGEPQLHAHAAVSARAATRDGRIFAIDGYGFHAIKDAMATAYTRAYQQLTTERLGFVYQQRADGVAREIAGVSEELLAEGSTRTLHKVRPLVADLVEAYTEKNGHEPGPRARRALVEQAVKDTRQPKTGQAGPGAVAAWVDSSPGRRERLADALEAAEQASVAAVVDGDAPRRAELDDVEGADLDGRDTARQVIARIEAARAAASSQTTAAAADTDGSTAAPPAREQGDVVADVSADGLADRVAGAVGRGITDVQAKYATWNVGNLTRAIDEHLGDHAGALGVPAAERPAFLAALAEHVLAEPQRFGIVQVSAGDPVPVPDMLRRTKAGEDGRSKFRAHIDERYATTAALTAEQRLLAGIRTTGAVRVVDERMVVVREQLARLPLSPDQAAAVAGVLTSGRSADVIVGPAGTGKSHTMGVLAVQWNAVTGGRVHGVASAEIAARNLAELGMDARNIHRFLRDFRPDPKTGRIRDRLGPQDLIVIDEAGMTPTADLVAIANLAAAAGAKVLYVGDHHQLQPVGAGGMFAHLAEQPEAFELQTVHRFTQAWEADASLLLRAGDPAAAVEYAARGRLICGTLDEITAMAVRGHVADMLDGKSALLIVSSNDLAAELSRQVRTELVARGRVAAEPLLRLPDSTPISVGDRIQARTNASRLHVTPGPDGSRMPVTNKEIYEVIGRFQDGTLLARDERGAVAHLPEHYVRGYVTLAYAVTAHAAQGVNVDVGRGVLGLGAAREQGYVPGTRGRECNLFYLETEHHPDVHDPQRVQETPVQRFTDILSRSSIHEAALTALEVARADKASMATLGGLYAVVSADYAHPKNVAILTEVLPSLADNILYDDACGALLSAVYAAELDGHDPRALLTEAVEMRNFKGALSLAKVMHWRVGSCLKNRVPESSPPQDLGVGRDWGALARLLPESHPVRTYLLSVSELIETRQDTLGAEVAADPPAWALQRLPAVPDPQADPDGRADWERRAGIAAGYREYRGIPESQISLGEPPPPAQQFARAMWLDAVEQLEEDPVSGRWTRASDAELHHARQTWQRTVRDADEHGPRSVAEEMSNTYRLAAEIRDDAVLTQADADHLPADDPRHAELGERAHRYRQLADRYLADARSLEHDHTARRQWWDQVAPLREADQAAAIELHRRSLLSSEPQQDTDDTHQPGERSSDEPDAPPRHAEPHRAGTQDPGTQVPGTQLRAAAASQPAGSEPLDRDITEPPTTEVQPATDAATATRRSPAEPGSAPAARTIPSPGTRPDSADPRGRTQDAVRALRETSRRSRLGHARRDAHQSAQQTEPERDGRATRAAADQRATEAARHGQRTDTPTPQAAPRAEQPGGPNAARSRDIGHDHGPDSGPDYAAEDGYSWD